MSSTTKESPLVLISGAGLSGLLLGQLLERAGIEYHIFERATKARALGSALSLHPNIQPLFEQLGMLEELNSFSTPVETSNIRDGELNLIGTMGLKGREKLTGYNSRLFARPQLHDLLLSRVPPHKISLGKKIVNVEETADKVTVHCSDNSTHSGTILVGADGAYSAVRSSMYKAMSELKILPKVDSEDLVAGFTCLVGVTNALDPEVYPVLKNGQCNAEFTIGDVKHIWILFCTPGNKIAWAFMAQFPNTEEAKQHRFTNSEWGPEANAAMIDEFRDKPCVYGGTLSALIDATPEDLISKVYLEHKMFETWFHKRSVLIGDACHKMLPSAGQGAINSFQDATILANCLYDLKDNSQESVSAAFQSYYDQRYSHAKEQYENSIMFSKFLSGQTWTERLIRHAFLNYMPKWFLQDKMKKSYAYRPQATFLPMVPFRGTGPVLPQLPSKRYQLEQEAKKKEERREE